MILRVLQGNIIINHGETPVRLIQSPPTTDNTPCITIDSSGGTRNLGKYFTNKDYPLPPDHPQYDHNHPERLFSRQILLEKRGVDLDLNIWCNTEDEREEIITQIRTLFYLAQSDNYRFCSNYNKNTHECNCLEETCPTFELTEPDTRGSKGQCMDPNTYGYKNIFTEYDIVRGSFDVEPAYPLDDLNKENLLMRSVIRVSCDYYDTHIIGGIVSDRIINVTK